MKAYRSPIQLFWIWSRRTVGVLFLLTLIVTTLLIAYPKPALRYMGDWLVSTDEVRPVEALFVLSGAPQERAAEAARLLRGPLREARVVCTGELTPGVLKTLNLTLNEGQLTQMALIQEGVDPGRIEVYPYGTSTWEEAGHIWKYSQDKGLRRIAVVTSALHTRRTRWSLEKRRLKGDAELFVYGAAPTTYQLDSWWQTEDGLLFVNNEYIKFCHYTLNY